MIRFIKFSLVDPVNLNTCLNLADNYSTHYSPSSKNIVLNST